MSFSLDIEAQGTSSTTQTSISSQTWTQIASLSVDPTFSQSFLLILSVATDGGFGDFGLRFKVDGTAITNANSNVTGALFNMNDDMSRTVTWIASPLASGSHTITAEIWNGNTVSRNLNGYSFSALSLGS